LAAGGLEILELMISAEGMMNEFAIYHERTHIPER